jgi:hypothetical protein
MDTDALLALIGASRLFPYDLVEAAEEDRNGFAEAAIRNIEAYVADSDSCPHEDAVLVTFHMLASWRRKEAYPTLLRLLSMEPEQIDYVIGDASTETSHRVIASVYDGDPEPLFDLIRNETLDAFVRGRMTEAAAMLTLRGDLQRDRLLVFLRECFERFKEEPDDWIWNGWLDAVARVPLRELLPQAEEVLDKYIDPISIDPAYFRLDLERTLAGFNWLEDRDWSPFGDVGDEIGHWHGFTEAYWEQRDRRTAPVTADDYEDIIEAVDRELILPGKKNLYRDVGRNDPCPCGSGKKFKACHLNQQNSQ